MTTPSANPMTTVSGRRSTTVDAGIDGGAPAGMPPSRRRPSTDAWEAPVNALARRAAARELYLATLDSWLTARTDEEEDRARRVLDEALDLMGVAAPGERRKARRAVPSPAAPRRACAARH
jgi:hypothetical protein